MRCFVVPAPGHYRSATTVLSSHRSPRFAYRVVDAQDDPSAWVVRRGDMKPGAPWIHSMHEASDVYPVVPRRAGRPPSDDPTRTTWLRARVTPAERAEVIAAAKAAGKRESQFIVEATLAASRTTKTT